MHGPTCVFWADLTPRSLQLLRGGAPAAHPHRFYQHLVPALPLGHQSPQSLVAVSVYGGCAAVLKISDTFQVPFRAAWHPADPAEALFAVGLALDVEVILTPPCIFH